MRGLLKKMWIGGGVAIALFCLMLIILPERSRADAEAQATACQEEQNRLAALSTTQVAEPPETKRDSAGRQAREEQTEQLRWRRLIGQAIATNADCTAASMAQRDWFLGYADKFAQAFALALAVVTLVAASLQYDFMRRNSGGDHDPAGRLDIGIDHSPLVGGAALMVRNLGRTHITVSHFAMLDYPVSGVTASVTLGLPPLAQTLRIAPDAMALLPQAAVSNTDLLVVVRHVDDLGRGVTSWARLGLIGCPARHEKKEDGRVFQ